LNPVFSIIPMKMGVESVHREINALANLAGAIVIDKAFDHHIIKIIITQTSLEYSVLKTRADYPSFFWFVDIENCVIVYLIIICH